MNINNMLLSDYFMLHKDYKGREADFYVCIFSLMPHGHVGRKSCDALSREASGRIIFHPRDVL